MLKRKHTARIRLAAGQQTNESLFLSPCWLAVPALGHPEHSPIAWWADDLIVHQSAKTLPGPPPSPGKGNGTVGRTLGAFRRAILTYPSRSMRRTCYFLEGHRQSGLKWCNGATPRHCRPIDLLSVFRETEEVAVAASSTTALVSATTETRAIPPQCAVPLVRQRRPMQ